jgi:hypothetical protein
VSRIEITNLIRKDSTLSSALVTQNGILYCCYDTIRISQEEESIVTRLYWLGEVVITLKTKCALSDGEILTLTGFQGRTEVRLEG